MRTGPVSGLLLTAHLVACQQQPELAPTGRVAVAPSRTIDMGTEPLPPVTSLSGAWRVAAIDGKTLDEPYGLALTGDQDRLWWQPTCAGMIRKYRIDGRSIRIGSVHPEAKAGSPTSIVCAIGLPPRLREVFRALDAASHVNRTPENGVLIGGGGYSVTLFSQ